MTTLKHGQLMKHFFNFMTEEWKYEHGFQYSDPHELMKYYLGQNFTADGTLVPDPYCKKQYYIQNYNNPYDDFDEGYDSWS